MGKPKPPPPPDYSGVAAASERAAELNFKLGQEQLEWAREQHAKDSEFYSKIVDGYLTDMDENAEVARADREFYEKFFQPLEQALAEEAENYDTPERREQEMGAAQANVAQQFDAQRENAQRELEAYGIDPSSTRYAALDIGMRTAQGAASAQAGTQASNRVEDVGRALRSEAINVGRGYPGQIAQSYATSHGAGSGAAGTVGQATQVGGQTMGTAPQYFGGANSAIGQWGNTLNMGYNNQMAHWKASQQSSGIGGALGLIGGIATGFFDEGGYVDGNPPIPQEGGAIDDDMSPSQGARTDDVPARLNAGEFVIPEEVVSWYGEKHMYSLIEKAAKDREQAKQITGAVPEYGPAPNEAPAFRSA